MADAGGALEQQQGIAARIPYENIGLRNPGETFLNAWGISTQLKLKQQELGDKMRALMLKNNQMQFMDEFKEKSFAQTLAVKEAQMSNEANARSVLNAYRLSEEHDKAQRTQLAADRLQFSVEKNEDKNDAQKGLMMLEHQLDEEGYKAGTAAWAYEMKNRASQLVAKMPASEFTATNKMVNDNILMQTQRQQKLTDEKLNAFKQRVGSELYHSSQFTDTAAIEHPENLYDVTQKDPKAHFSWDPWVPVGKGDQREKEIAVIDPTTGKRKVVGKATVKQLTDLNNEYQQLLKESGETYQPPNTHSNDPDIQDARDAIAAAKAKGQDITPQVKDRIRKMGKNPDDI